LISAGPQTPLGELTALPQTPYLDLRGPTSKGREVGDGRRGRVRKRQRGRRGRGKEGKGRGKEKGGESVPLALILQFDHWAKRTVTQQCTSR